MITSNQQIENIYPVIFPADYLNSILPPPLQEVVYVHRMDLGALVEIALSPLYNTRDFLVIDRWENELDWDTLCDYVTDLMTDDKGNVDINIMENIEGICLDIAWFLYQQLHRVIVQSIIKGEALYGELHYVHFTDTTETGVKTDPTIILGFAPYRNYNNLHSAPT